MKKFKSLMFIIGLSIVALLAACGGETGATDQKDTETNLGEEVDYTIMGIEPGGGMMTVAADMLVAYENLAGWEVLEASTPAMLVELEKAIANEEPIIVTAWNPHWKFLKYDLKYLEDPLGVWGEEENYHTLTRLGLEEDMPEAYEILDRFYWSSEDMEQVMYGAEDTSFEEAAQKWVNENEDKVNEWTDGVDKVDGEAIELISHQWDSEYASGEVMRIILEEQGFDVTITPVDPAVAFAALANGEVDATVAPWLPATHGALYAEHEGNFVDLGPNLTEARVGIAVPTYMEDINSIEDIPAKE